MKAIIEASGKQFLVEKGTIIYTEKVEGVDGDKIVFDNVLMVDDNFNPKAKVEGKIIKQGKQKKIIVFKYNPKKKYRKKQGHRQPYTKIEITKVEV